MDELRAISTFIRAAELGSFNRAAHAQGSTPQAVSKAIRQLEEHLGVRLFHRTTRKSALTDDGARLLESVRDSMEGARAAMSRVRCAAYEDEGLIRISAGGAVGRKVLMPVLAEFSTLYPAITFDLVSRGVGPARVRWVEVDYDGHRVDDSAQLLDRCCAREKQASGQRTVTTTSGIHPRVVGPDEWITFFHMPREGNAPAVWHALERGLPKIVMRACYCSVLDDCWMLDSRQPEPAPVVGSGSSDM